jgi:ATP-dependent DNA helicase RecG
MMSHSELQKSIQYVKGIGPKRSEVFARLGIFTIEDLLYYFPRSYQDRSSFTPLSNPSFDQAVTVKGKVVAKGVHPTRAMKIFELVIDDGHARLWCVFFNQPYLDTTFHVDDEVIVSGTIELYKKRMQMNSPDYEIVRPEENETVHTGRIVPIYPLSEGLTQRALRNSMKKLIDDYGHYITENLPEPIIAAHKLMARNEALASLHFPLNKNQYLAAYTRIVYEEFFLFEKAIAEKIHKRKAEKNFFPIRERSEYREIFCDLLPFTLTHSQQNVICEILKDFTDASPMYRVLQGDVGSGKTIVAAYGLYLAVRSGYQGALLVPTEILAEQHFKTLEALFSKLKICVALLTGSSTKKEKDSICTALKKGKIDVLIGTHALLTDDISFLNLGYVVIDEQHKFGVEQRAVLTSQPKRPHVLVMSATPIPRTLGLALFADLNVSTLRELPHGERTIKTFWINDDKVNQVYNSVKKRLDQGDQAYIVYPLVEESLKTDLKAATDEFVFLSRNVFQGYTLGLVHGKMDKKQKNKIMNDFKNKVIHVLVATTVIEVGIDNSNASMIIIQHAERFGLSQLHQMRGRVGRGKKESFCFLIGNPSTEIGKKRLRLMTKTNDGFKISEQDLFLRGPGEFLGTRQSGLPQFKLADIVKDSDLLEKAKIDAFSLYGVL